jgi:hypothetical protein
LFEETMSKFAKISLCIACLAPLALATTPAQERDGRTRTGASIAAALRLMDAAYPELAAGTVQIEGKSHENGVIRFFGIQLARGDEIRPLRSGEDLRASLCYGVFEFHLVGTLNSYHANGQCVRMADNEALTKIAETKKDWTDTTFVELLNQRGAKYGPDRESQLVRRLPPLEVMETLTGEKLEVSRIRAPTPRRDQGDQLFPYSLCWRVNYLVRGKPDVRYEAYFEPFDGALSFILRRPKLD